MFFERLQNTPAGGEAGKRIGQVRSRPVFGLTYGRMRGAVWFDRTRPPQGIVWLLGAEVHDERHKGRADAYDVFAELEARGELFPREVDYERLELDRRLVDTASFADDARRDARGLIERVIAEGRVDGELVGIPIRLIADQRQGLVALHGAVSTRLVLGRLSGVEFPLTNDRFLMTAETVRAAAEDLFGPEVLAEELHHFPDSLRDDERGFVILFESPG